MTFSTYKSISVLKFDSLPDITIYESVEKEKHFKTFLFLFRVNIRYQEFLMYLTSSIEAFPLKVNFEKLILSRKLAIAIIVKNTTPRHILY